MSYTTEQFEKHKEYIENELADCSHDDRSDVLRLLRTNWPTDDEVKEYVVEKRKQISKRASPEEIDEIFKNLGF